MKKLKYSCQTLICKDGFVAKSPSCAIRKITSTHTAYFESEHSLLTMINHWNNDLCYSYYISPLDKAFNAIQPFVSYVISEPFIGSPAFSDLFKHEGIIYITPVNNWKQ